MIEDGIRVELFPDNTIVSQWSFETAVLMSTRRLIAGGRLGP